MAKVQIKIKSTSTFPQSGTDSMEGCYKGDFTLRENGFSFSYGQEENEEIEGTTIITGNGAEVTLERKGGNAWVACFVEGEEHHSQYHTPYGMIPAVVQAEKVSYDISTLGGSLTLEYSLGFQGSDHGKINFYAELEILK